jgi:hypothetical protein
MEALDKLIAKYELEASLKRSARELAVSSATNVHLAAEILLLLSVINDLKAEKELLKKQTKILNKLIDLRNDPRLNYNRTL